MKKINLKKILTFVLICTLLFNIKGVNAADTAPATLKMKYRNYTPPIKFPQTFHIKETTSGKYVYCATYAKNMPVTSIKYTRVGKYTDPGINYILEQGYKAKNDKQYFIAQTAFWIYLMDKKQMNYSNSVNTFKSSISNSSNDTARKIKELVNKAKSLKSYDQSAPTIKLTGNKITFTLSSDKQYYVSNNIKVKSSENKYKVQLVNAPKGTTYNDNKGTITIKVPASSITNTSTNFKIKVSNEKTIYKSYKYKPSNSKYQYMTATYPVDKKASASKTMSLAVDKILISKQDVSSKSELPGATLEVKNANGNVVDKWVSTNTPHEMKLVPGTYTLTETIAPEGYDLSTESIKFTVTNKGITTKVVMYNTPTKKEVPQISISKQDVTTKEELPGATLELKDSEGKVIDTWVSEATPHVVTDLEKGTYTLTETIAPEGYELATESITFEVNEEGKTTTPVVMYNTPKKEIVHQVSITKQDADTKEIIEGATLEIRDANNEVVETFVSTKEPYVLTDLEPGTYTLVETEAPDGYNLTNEQVSFTVKEDSEETINVVMYNKKTPQETPGEEIAVPSTGSFTTISSSIIGIAILAIGSVLITKNIKKKNGI